MKRRLITKFQGGTKVASGGFNPNNIIVKNKTFLDFNNQNNNISLNDDYETSANLNEITVKENKDLLNFFRILFPDKDIRTSLYNADKTMTEGLLDNNVFITTNSLLDRIRNLHTVSNAGVVRDWNKQDEIIGSEFPEELNSVDYGRRHERLENGAGRAFSFTVDDYGLKKNFIFIDPFLLDKSGLTTLYDLFAEYTHPFNFNHMPDRYHINETAKDLEEYDKRRDKDPNVPYIEWTYDLPYHNENIHNQEYGIEPEISRLGTLGDVQETLPNDGRTYKIMNVTPEYIKNRVLNNEYDVLWKKLYDNPELYYEAIKLLSKTLDGQIALERLKSYIKSRREHDNWLKNKEKYYKRNKL